jgi:hypothetical protein
MQNLFPRDRFLTVDLVAIANSSDSDCRDNEIEVGLNLGQNSSLTLCFPGLDSENDGIPDQIVEILTQFNQIDNIVQSSCEKFAHASSLPANNHQFVPAIIYLEPDGTVFIDYWGISVNTQWPVYLGKRDDKWIPFQDLNLTNQL